MFRFLHYTSDWIFIVKKFRVHIVLVCDFILSSLPDSIEKMFSKGSQLVLAKVQNTEDSPPYPRPRLLATGKSVTLDGIPPLLGSSWPLLSDYIPIFIHSSPVRYIFGCTLLIDIFEGRLLSVNGQMMVIDVNVMMMIIIGSNCLIRALLCEIVPVKSFMFRSSLLSSASTSLLLHKEL